MNNKSIALFDSGVGGLSIWQQVKNLLPKENIIYFADQAFCPYGNLDQNTIIDRVVRSLRFVQEKGAKLAVIACNTATTVGIDRYRQEVPEIPIIGVVPVIKTASEETKTKKVLILATKKTIEGNYLDYLIDKFGQGVEFIKVNGNGKLVEFVEKGELDSPELTHYLRKKVEPYLSSNFDIVTLGCTHYPFIKSSLQKIVGSRVTILDSGGAVARHVNRVLKTNELLADENQPRYTFYTTGEKERFKHVAKILVNIPSLDVKEVKI